MDHPWILQQKPFHVVGDIYFVGNNYVSCFLIDGGKDGLILIDCAFQETAYLLFDSIRALGFDPANIKKLFLSHGHVDHCGAARQIFEYSGCEIYLGERDAFFFTERADLILFEEHVPRFPIHHYYEYEKPIVWGNSTIIPILTPGHTPGATTMFIHTPYINGNTLTCAMHGGIGINGLSREELVKNNLPLSLQQEFLDSLERLSCEQVDVVIASHAHQYDLLKRATEDDGSGKSFLDDGSGWRELMNRHIVMMKELMK